MKNQATPEHLIHDQLAACLQAMQDCLSHSRQPRTGDADGDMRRADVEYVGKLMKASARLTEALAKLRGDTRHSIQVTRQGG